MRAMGICYGVMSSDYIRTLAALFMSNWFQTQILATVKWRLGPRVARWSVAPPNCSYPPLPLRTGRRWWSYPIPVVFRGLSEGRWLVLSRAESPFRFGYGSLYRWMDLSVTAKSIVREQQEIVNSGLKYRIIKFFNLEVLNVLISLIKVYKSTNFNFILLGILMRALKTP